MNLCNIRYLIYRFCQLIIRTLPASNYDRICVSIYSQRLGFFTSITICAVLALTGVTRYCHANCADVRLDQNGGPFEAKIPMYNQRNTFAICYAFSLSQMIDAYRFSHGDQETSHRTSPVAIAVAFSAKNYDKLSVEYGSAVEAFQAIKDFGSCDFAYLRDELRKAGNSTAFIREYFEIFSKLNQEGYTNHHTIKPFFNEKFYSELSCKLVPLPINQVNLKLLVEYLNKQNPLQFLNQIISDICKHKSIPLDHFNLPELKSLNKIAGVKLTETIASRFKETNPQPVTINYCQDVRFNKNHRMYSDDGNMAFVVDSINHSFVLPSCKISHESVIIGTQQKGGKCRFLVRDTFGTYCDPKTEAFECENGQFWIDQDALERNLHRISYF